LEETEREREGAAGKVDDGLAGWLAVDDRRRDECMVYMKCMSIPRPVQGNPE
jgi:hypothetical protein